MTGTLQREVPWNMLFAEDVIQSGETGEEIEGRLENRNRQGKIGGLRVSKEKEEWSCLRGQGSQVLIEGNELKRMNGHKYLGPTAQKMGGQIRKWGEGYKLDGEGGQKSQGSDRT